MKADSAVSLNKPQRRRAMRLAYENGGLWSIGNGMVGSTLITYLALELGAAGFAASLILATPRFIGALRMFTPQLLAWLGNRKQFCLLTYAASNLVLLILPILSAPGTLPSATAAITALVVSWSLYHLLEYCGTVALTSWLGDLAPRRLRGRFFGRRERWLTLGRILGMLVAGAFTYGWSKHFPRSLRWQGYALAADAGAVMMLVSLLPLWRMPRVTVTKQTPVDDNSPREGDAVPHASNSAWTTIASPPFLRLLLFGCLFSLVNGITQTAQNLFPYRVLQLHLFVLLGLEAFMRLGQGIISPALGRWIDRFGNRPVMIGAQTIAALGLLFYLPASQDQPAWILGAWICWMAYAGLNIALSTLTIKLASPRDPAFHLAVFFGLTGVVYGISTISGGLLFDALADWQFEMTLWGKRSLVVDRYQLLFAVGIAGRLLAALSLCWLIEPGARRLRGLFVPTTT